MANVIVGPCRFFPRNRALKTPVYLRWELPYGIRVEGPAIIEQYDTTVVVNRGVTVRIDEAGPCRLSTLERRVLGFVIKTGPTLRQSITPD